MFKYNELSDLKTGELVKPIQLDGEYIICLNEEGSEKRYSFDDFDFDKTPEERLFIVEDANEVETEVDTEVEVEVDTEVEADTETEADTDTEADTEADTDTEVETEAENKKIIDDDRSGFVTDDDEKLIALKHYGNKNLNLRKINIFRDTVYV